MFFLLLFVSVMSRRLWVFIFVCVSELLLGVYVVQLWEERLSRFGLLISAAG